MRSFGLLFSLAMLAGSSGAQDLHDEERVLEAARSLVPYFAMDPPAGLSEKFTSTFLRVIEQNRLDLPAIFRDLHRNHGKIVEIRYLYRTQPLAAEMEFVFERGVRVPTSLTLDGRAPHRIAGLLFRGPVKDGDSLDDVKKELKALPGKAGFALTRLGDAQANQGDRAKLIPVADFNQDEKFAVGSSFKLVVFGALLEEVRLGRRKWSDVVAVRKEWASLPSGIVQTWPTGAPVTLHTLAILMVARSDNTATDHLVETLGRETIEKIQVQMGVKHDEWNRPWLSTADMFRVKMVLEPARQNDYLAADEAGKRTLLNTLRRDLALKDHRTLGDPAMIDEVEWFFTPADLTRIMEWLRRHPDPEAQAILGINPGLSFDKKHWSYIGFKGGAEPGVLAYSFLLKSSDDTWYALSVMWNNPREEVDHPKLTVLTQRLARLVQRK
jgi:beta-lactamase class A